MLQISTTYKYTFSKEMCLKKIYPQLIEHYILVQWLCVIETTPPQITNDDMCTDLGSGSQSQMISC